MPRTSKKSVTHGDYVAGWLDSSIRDFIEVFPTTFSSMKYALITSLDSNCDLASLFDKVPKFRSLMMKARPLGRGLLLPAEKLLNVEFRDQVFFGFDEVWFFPSKEVEPKPETAWLVGPARIDQKTLNLLGDWMKSNSCSLAFGDGDGLNFVVKAGGLVRHLLAHSHGQPVPTTRGDLVFEEEIERESPV